MKNHFTIKETKKYKRRIVAGYCELAYLLMFKDPEAYHASIYGWDYDCYIIDESTVILTGYRNMPGNIYPDLEILNRYNEEAQRIYKEVTPAGINSADFYTLKQEKINNLLVDFINEIIKK